MPDFSKFLRKVRASMTDTQPTTPASAEVDILSCKASELQEYGCACRWEGMKLADICDAHKEAFKASGAAVQVPEDATDEMVEAGANAVEQGIVHLSAGYFRKIWKAMLAAAPQKQGA